MKQMCVVLVSVALFACVVAFPQSEVVPEAPAVPAAPSQPAGVLGVVNNAATAFNNAVGNVVNTAWNNIQGFATNTVQNTQNGFQGVQQFFTSATNGLVPNAAQSTSQKQTAEKKPVAVAVADKSFIEMETA